MVKYHTLRRKRPSIQLSPPIATFLLALFLAYVALSSYLISEKNKDLLKYRNVEVKLRQDLKEAHGDMQQQLRDFDRERQELNRIIAELRERLKVLDVIKDFSEGAMAEDEQVGLANVIYDESRRFGYDPLMILAIIITESHFRPDARSRVGATGLMQVMPFVGKDLANQVTAKSPGLWADDRPIEWTGRETLLDPVQNVRLGMLHLCQLIIKFRSVRDGIRAYNFGPTSLEKRIRTGRRLPKLYVQTVMSQYEDLKENYGPRAEILKSAASGLASAAPDAIVTSVSAAAVEELGAGMSEFGVESATSSAVMAPVSLGTRQGFGVRAEQQIP